MYQLTWPAQEVKLPSGIVWRMPANKLEGKSKSALERLAIQMETKYKGFRYEIKKVVPEAWRQY